MGHVVFIVLHVLAIMFGLAFAMVLTLVLIPVFFYRYPGKRFAHLK